MAPIQYYPAGDMALVAEFGQQIDEQINDRVHAMARWIREKNIRGISEVIPTFRSLLICYDPCKIAYSLMMLHRRKSFTAFRCATMGRILLTWSSSQD